MNTRKNIAVVGVGLIGGSLALRLHEKKLSSKIIGVDNNIEHLKEALERELIDETLSLEEAIKDAEVIILSIPVNAITKLLPTLLDKIENQIVMDVGSTKSSILNSIKNHPKRGRFIATHPMWGTEYSGPKAALIDSFENKAVIICEQEKTDKDVIEWVEMMYKKIGMHINYMNSTAHDLHIAYISHISHITSFALANTVFEKEKTERNIFEMASGGFESTVRLAKSNPDMWIPILMQNKENIIEVLQEHIYQLGLFNQAIKNDDATQLATLITNANKIKNILN